MALIKGVNCGFVTVAPSSDPEAAFTITLDNNSYAMVDTAPEGAEKITEIGWYIGSATEEANFQVGIYDNNVGDSNPENRVGVDTTNAKGTDAGWKVVTGLNIPINAGTIYWIAVQLDNTATTSGIDRDQVGGEFISTNSEANSLVDPWGASSQTEGRLIAIYAVCETAIPSEGNLQITGITKPESATEGSTVDFTVHTQNTGDDDDFKVEVIGDITDSSEFFLVAGSTQDVPFSFIMPSYDANMTVNTYHWEEPPPQVVFRTNADISTYGCEAYNETIGTDGNGIWIAYDILGDGNLVGFGKTSGALTEFNCSIDPSSNPHGIDAAGGCRFYKRDDEDIGVCFGAISPRKFYSMDADAVNAILDSSPVEPYASSGQEVYA